MGVTEDLMHYSGSATMGEVLKVYLDRGGQWWWMLTTEQAVGLGELMPVDVVCAWSTGYRGWGGRD